MGFSRASLTDPACAHALSPTWDGVPLAKQEKHFDLNGDLLDEGALDGARVLFFMDLAACNDQAQKRFCAEGLPVVHTTGPGLMQKRETLQDAQGTEGNVVMWCNPCQTAQAETFARGSSWALVPLALATAQLGLCSQARLPTLEKPRRSLPFPCISPGIGGVLGWSMTATSECT